MTVVNRSVYLGNVEEAAEKFVKSFVSGSSVVANAHNLGTTINSMDASAADKTIAYFQAVGVLLEHAQVNDKFAKYFNTGVAIGNTLNLVNKATKEYILHGEVSDSTEYLLIGQAIDVVADNIATRLPIPVLHKSVVWGVLKMASLGYSVAGQYAEQLDVSERRLQEVLDEMGEEVQDDILPKIEDSIRDIIDDAYIDYTSQVSGGDISQAEALIAKYQGTLDQASVDSIGNMLLSEMGQRGNNLIQSTSNKASSFTNSTSFVSIQGFLDSLFPDIIFNYNGRELEEGSAFRIIIDSMVVDAVESYGAELLGQVTTAAEAYLNSIYVPVQPEFRAEYSENTYAIELFNEHDELIELAKEGIPGSLVALSAPGVNFSNAIQEIDSYVTELEVNFQGYLQQLASKTSMAELLYGFIVEINTLVEEKLEVLTEDGSDYDLSPLAELISEYGSRSSFSSSEIYEEVSTKLREFSDSIIQDAESLFYDGVSNENGVNSIPLSDFVIDWLTTVNGEGNESETKLYTQLSEEFDSIFNEELKSVLTELFNVADDFVDERFDYYSSSINNSESSAKSGLEQPESKQEVTSIANSGDQKLSSAQADADGQLQQLEGLADSIDPSSDTQSGPLISNLADNLGQLLEETDNSAGEITDDTIDAIGDVEDKEEEEEEDLPPNDMPPTWQPPSDPLVLDLDGNGITTLVRSYSVYFDHDGDGIRERTGWINRDDGFLVLDVDNNGKIESGAELFGNYTKLSDGTFASGGFIALADYDSNEDLWINSDDEVFSRLRVWNDRNSNGISDLGELITLDSQGIEGISLDFEWNLRLESDGSYSDSVSTMQMSDGRVLTVEDFWFVSMPEYQSSEEVELSPELKALPNVKAFGIASSLLEAAAADESLAEAYTSMLNTPAKEWSEKVVDDVIFRWFGLPISGSDQVVSDNKISVALEITGSDWSVIDSNWAVNEAISLYNDFLRYFKGQVLLKSEYSEELSLISFQSSRTGEFNVEFSSFVERVAHYLDTGQIEKSLDISKSLYFAGTYSSVLAELFTELGGEERTGFIFGEWLLGTKSDDGIFGNRGRPGVILAGEGDDTISGSYRSDTYIFRRGDGEDRISDQSRRNDSETDRLVFGESINPDDIRLSVDYRSKNLIVEVLDSGNEVGDRIVIERALSNATNDIEEFIFSDGTVLTQSGPSVKPFEFQGSEGLDRLNGSGARPVNFFGGKGDDYLYGGVAANIYYFNRGDGHDQISDYSIRKDDGYIDKLVFGEGITPEDIRLSADSTYDNPALIINVLSDGVETGDKIALSNALFDKNALIEELIFDDGTVLNLEELLLEPFENHGTEGDDWIDGVYRKPNSFFGGKGNDKLDGHEMADHYYFNRGDGRDVIKEYTNGNDVHIDRLIFGEGIRVEDIRLTSDSNSSDIVLQILSDGEVTEDRITLPYALNDSSKQIEELHFVDGTVLTMAELLSRPFEQHGTDGNDYLDGTYQQNNSFYGGRGNDNLYSYDTTDSYYFNRGDGRDSIEDQEMSGSNIDRLIFGEGIRAEDIRLAGESGSPDVILKVLENGEATGDQITLSYALNDSRYLVEELHFADGTVLNMAELLSRPFEQHGTSGNDNLYGLDHKASTFHGGWGNDELTGYEAADSYYFNRGDGQDRISDEDYSGDGNVDRLVFGEGIGVGDVRLTAEIGSSDIVLKLLDNGLLTEDQITLQYALDGGEYQIEELHFADGSILSMAELLSRPLEQYGTPGDDSLSGLENKANSFYGGQGNDVLFGHEAADSYYFNRGDGQDQIEDYDWNNSSIDRLVFGEGIRAEDISLTAESGGSDLVLNILENGQETGDQLTIRYVLNDGSYQIEELHFADGSNLSMSELLSRPLEQLGTDGDDSLYGLEQLASSFHGGLGNDQLYGFGAADSYHFNRGDGHDQIEDQDWSGSSADRLVFGAGISTEDILLTVESDSSDIVLKVLENGAETGDQLTLRYALNSSDYQIEELHFANGTVLYMAELLSQTQQPSQEQSEEGNNGDSGDNSGQSNEQNDNPVDNSEDTDGWYFSRGDGWREFDSDSSSNSSQLDRLVFGTGIRAEDIRLTAESGSSDAILQVLENGQETGDQLTLRYALDDSNYQIEELHFADGTVLSATELLSRPLEQYGTSGDDYLEGRSDRASSFHGGQGNDELTGYEAADSYYFNRGDGQDQIEDQDWSGGNTDRVVFGAGIGAEDIRLTAESGSSDIVLTVLDNGQETGDQLTLRYALSSSDYQIEELHFADGTVLGMTELLNSTQQPAQEQSDTAGNGNSGDTSGQSNEQNENPADNSEGADGWYFSRGDGQREIDSGSSSDGSQLDQLVFGAGIRTEDIRLTAVSGSSDVILKVFENGQDTGDQLTLRYVLDGSDYHIEELHFEDGTVLSMPELLSSPLELHGSDGDDYLEGRNDQGSSFHGGQGNDQLIGYEAADSYYFNRGDGQDRIEDQDWSGSNTDRLLFGAGITAADIRLTAEPGSSDVVLKVLDNGMLTDDQITLSYALDGSDYHIEELHFEDGTVLSMSELLSRPLELYGSDGDDYLAGLSEHGSSFYGGAGNDQLIGYEAADNYYYNRGDGQDRIEDQDWSGSTTDRLVFGAGIAAEDIRLTTQSGSSDVVLQVLENGALTDDQITLSYALDDSSYHIEELHFDDGTMLSMSDLMSRPLELYGSDGDDYLEGRNDQGSSFHGGAGNDQLIGYEAADSYHFNRGDGQDRIEDQDWSGGNTDRLMFGAGITAADIRLTAESGSSDVVLQVLDNGMLTDDQITLSYVLDGSDYHIEELHFEDGTVLSMAELLSRPLELHGTDGDDYLEGRNDQGSSFHGGQGNDQLIGYEAADSYHFNRGDGRDWISDEDYSGDGNIDRLVFGDGISVDDIRLAAISGSSDLVVQLLDNGQRTEDQLTLAYALDDSNYRIEELVFADGTVLSMAACCWSSRWSSAAATAMTVSRG